MMMLDQIFDRAYQGSRHQLNAPSPAGEPLLTWLFKPFRVLHRIEYHAPWAERRSSGHCR